ncbi:hypothetical protein Tco_1404277 [Tanacetum coccineum]
MYRFQRFLVGPIVISCVIDLRSNTPRTLIPLRPNLGVLQIGIKSQGQITALLSLWTGRSGVTQRDVGYGITDSWDEIVETLQGAPVSTDTELGAHVREFESMVRRDTDEIYTMLDDEQSQRHLLAGRVNMLFRDRRAHAHTRYLIETEVRMSREAWGRSMDANLLETDRRRREEMRELRAADRARQQQIIQILTVMQTLQREMIPLQGLVTALQGQVTALQGQVTALQGQQGPAGGPAQPELPEEASSSS